MENSEDLQGDSEKNIGTTGCIFDLSIAYLFSIAVEVANEHGLGRFTFEDLTVSDESPKRYIRIANLTSYGGLRQLQRLVNASKPLFIIAGALPVEERRAYLKNEMYYEVDRIKAIRT